MKYARELLGVLTAGLGVLAATAGSAQAAAGMQVVDDVVKNVPAVGMITSEAPVDGVLRATQ